MEIKRDPYKAWQKVKDIPGGAMSKRERLRRAKEKDSVYPIGDGEKEIKIKPGAQTKKGPTMGLEPTWV